MTAPGTDPSGSTTPARSTDPVTPDEGGEPGRLLFRVALGLFTIGVLAIAAIFLIHGFSSSSPGLALYLIALACPLGLLLSIAAALRNGRRAR